MNKTILNRGFLALQMVIFCTVFAQAWEGIVVEAGTQSPLPGVRMSLTIGQDSVLIETVSDPLGRVSMPDSIISKASWINFSAAGYADKHCSLPLPPLIGLEPKSAVELGEVVVKGIRNTYTLRKGTIAYEVSRDSLMRRRTAWDALRQTPLIIVDAQDGVSVVPGYSGIEFRMNGLRDPMLSDGNFLRSALETVPASLVDRIVVTTRNTPGGDVLEVNFVTKTRLEGAAGQYTTAVSDSKWSNTLYGIARAKRLTISASYMNVWNWSHTSTERRDEYRTESEDLYRHRSTTKDMGYKADIHRYKAYATYEIDDRTLIAVDAMMFRKTDPHTLTNGTGKVYNRDGKETLGYSFAQSMRQTLDAEYDAYISLQRRLSQGGHAYVIYNIYSRPLNSVTGRQYDLTMGMEGAAAAYSGFLYDMRHATKNRYTVHTIRWEWERMVSRRGALRFDAKGRSLTDNIAGSQRLEDAVSSSPTPIDIMTDTRHTQQSGFAQATFRYFGDNYEIRPSAVVQAYHDRQRLPHTQTNFDSHFVHVLPALKYLWQPKAQIIVSADYDMRKHVPTVEALNPTEDYSAAGTVGYGNPDLKPETSQSLNISLTWSKYRWLARLSSANRYSSNLILSHDFLDSDGLRNITYSNAARKMENSVSVYLSGRARRVSVTAFLSGNYVDYHAYNGIEGGNSGWYLNTRVSMEYSAPGDWYFRLSGNFNTARVYFQGNGNRDFGYSLAVSRSFVGGRLMVGADASSFIPVRYTAKTTNFAPGYQSFVENRYYHADLSLRISYKFGALKTREKGEKVNAGNSDIKSSYSD